MRTLDQLNSRVGGDCAHLPTVARSLVSTILLYSCYYIILYVAIEESGRVKINDKMLSRNVIIALIQRRRRIMKKRNREFWVHPIYTDRLLQGKFYTMHSKLLNFPKIFFDFYRMSINSFNELVKLIGPAIVKEDTHLRLSIPVEERLSVTIR